MAACAEREGAGRPIASGFASILRPDPRGSAKRACDLFLAFASNGASMMPAMTESLLDEAIAFCRTTMLEWKDDPERRPLETRLGVLERALWSASVMETPTHHFVQLARLILLLRAEVKRHARSRGAVARAEEERAVRGRCLTT